MSRGVNKAILIGNLGQDPEVRTAQSGTKVAKFSLATNRTFKNAQGQKVEDVQWHRCTAFGKLAEIVEEYVTKGDRVYVEGRIEYSQSEGDGGETRYWTDVIINQLVMLGGNGAQGGGSPRGGSDRHADSPVDEGALDDAGSDLPF